MARPSSDQASLLANLNYACSQVDCRVLRKGCPCSTPDSLINHASIAMNLYFQARGRNHWNCDFRGSGLIVITDPSKSFRHVPTFFLILRCEFHCNPISGLNSWLGMLEFLDTTFSFLFRLILRILISSLLLLLSWNCRLWRLHLCLEWEMNKKGKD